MHNPTDTPAMAASASGVSNPRSPPNSACRPSVTRNTPPSLPTSSPSTSDRGSSASEWRSASFSALTMVTSVIGPVLGGEPDRLVALPGQVRREVAGEDPREQLLDRPRAGLDHVAPKLRREVLRLLFDGLEQPLVGAVGGRQPVAISGQRVERLPPLDLLRGS